MKRKWGERRFECGRMHLCYLGILPPRPTVHAFAVDCAAIFVLVVFTN